MKINKLNFLKLLGKTLASKLGVTSDNVDPTLTATSLAPIFENYKHNLTKLQIIDSDDRIDIDKLATEVRKVFVYIPSITIPCGLATLVITKADAYAFIDSLYKCADVEESAICLPYKESKE